MKPIQFHPWPIALLLAGVLLWVGCEAAKYREAADAEVYGILRDRGAAVLGERRGHRSRLQCPPLP